MFFFSSRRRHTRLQGDWSSDVCSSDLEIYLNRMKRLDPQLLCAVSILEGQAREAAQQADAEIRAGKYRGPLHGIPYGIRSEERRVGKECSADVWEDVVNILVASMENIS